MGADLVITIALLKQLKLLSAKEAKLLFDELKYKNLSMSIDDCIRIVEEAFKKHSIGKKPITTELEIDGKKITLTK